jgi:hypothetical protein
VDPLIKSNRASQKPKRFQTPEFPMQMHSPPENTGTYGELETVPKRVMDELRLMQATTVNVCIKCIESLKADSQGLTLDNNTIDACATMLRNLRDGSCV